MKRILLVLVLAITQFAISQGTLNELLSEDNIKGALKFTKTNHNQNPKNEKYLKEYLQLASINNIHGDDFLEILKKTKSVTDNPSAYYLFFWETAFKFNENGLTKNQLSELKSLLKDKKIDGSVKLKAKITLGNQSFLHNDFKTRNQHYAQIQNLINWSILGVFENVSASGFNKYLEPISKFKKTDQFINKKGKNISWFDTKKETKGSWLFIDNHINKENSVAFAQTFVTSNKDQEVEIRFGLTGSFKMWVNDALISQKQKETEVGEDVFVSKITLKKGINRILFQIGVSEFKSSNIYARITDFKGNPVSNLESSAFSDQYITNQASKQNLKYNDLGKYFIDQLDHKNLSLTDVHMAGKIYKRNFQVKQLRELLESAGNKYPKSSIVNISLLELYNHLEYWSLYSKKMEDIKKYNSAGPLCSEILFNEAVEREKYEEAKYHLSNLKSFYGPTSRILNSEISLYVKFNRSSSAINLINREYENHSNSYDMVRWKYEVATKIDKDLNEGLKLIKTYLKSNYDTRAMDDLGNHYLNSGNLELGIETFKLLKSNHPDKYGPTENLAKIYYASQKFDLARDYFNELIDQAPYVGELYDSRGDCYQELNDMTKAKEDYRKAVLYSPTLFEAREKIRFLDGKVSIIDQFKTPDLNSITQQVVSKDDYPEDNSVVLLNSKQVILYEGAGKEEIHNIVVSVLNNAGIDTWKEYSISMLKSQKLVLENAAIVKPNGDVMKAEANYNQIVFTGLGVNDKIVMTYKLKSYYDGSLSEHFWDTQYFQYYVPVKETRYSIIYHNSFNLKYRTSKMEINPEEKIIDDYTFLSWHKENTPSIKSELLMPPLIDNGAVLQLTTIPSWDYIIDWYDGLSKTKANADYEVKNLVKELFKDKKDLTDTEKAKVIYDYIVHNIRYSSVSFRQSGWIPQKASKVINTKVGDCKDVSTLFVILCKEVGIDANLVLVDSKDNGRKKMNLPSVEFNHCIAHADLDGKEYYIELTTDLNPFGSISGALKNAVGLNITPENKTNPIKIPASSHSKSTSFRHSKIVLNKENISVHTDNYKTGGYAVSLRGLYKDLGKESQFKEMASNLTFDFSTIQITDLHFDDNLNSNEDTLGYSYDFILNSPYTKIGNLNVFRVPLISDIKPFKFLTLEERKFDIELWLYMDIDRMHEKIEFDIPAGQKIVEIPKDYISNSKFGDYKMTFKQKGNKVEIERIFELKTDIVRVEDYKEFRDFMNPIFEKEKINIGLKAK